MLTFISTTPLQEFKERIGADVLEIRQNARTDKYYFICGSIRGAVSEKYIQEKGQNPVISLVEPDDGDAFYLLHSRDGRPTGPIQSL